MDKIILTSVSIDELKEIIRSVINEEMNKGKEKELLTFRETCEFLKCSPSFLNKLKSENKVPFRKLGKRVYFSESEIVSALKEDGRFRKLKEIE